MSLSFASKIFKASRNIQNVQINLVSHKAISSVSIQNTTSFGNSSFQGFYGQLSKSSFHTSIKLRNDEKEQKEPKEEKKEEESDNEEGNKEFKELQAKIQSLTKELEETKSKLVYSYAERENIRRISNIEIEKAKDFGIQSFAKSLLESADNFSRCLSAAKKEDLEATPAYKTFYEGVEMTEKILMKAFVKNGLEKFEPTVEKFDPNTMNALMFMSDPKKENGQVGACLKPGYILNKRVIRAADVGVVKNEAPADS